MPDSILKDAAGVKHKTYKGNTALTILFFFGVSKVTVITEEKKKIQTLQMLTFIRKGSHDD